MARGRLISKSFSTSERRGRLHESYPAALADYAQSLYMLTIAHTDDWGRAPGDAFTVKWDIDPISRHGLEDVAAALAALEAVGLILRYYEAGRWWLAIVDFEPHQSGLHKRTPSRIPNPPGSSGNFRELPGTSGNGPEIPGRARARNGREENRREEN